MPGNRSKQATIAGFRSLVVPLDGSRLSEQAIPLAVAIAERSRARLRLVLVSRPAVPPTAPLPLSSELRQLYVSLERQARTSEKAYLTAFADQLRKQSPSLDITSTTLRGPVAEAVLAYVSRTRSDLVVMTSRGHGGLRRLWLGSVADAVIRGSSAPVLLVRPEETASPQPVLENLSQVLVPLDGSALSETILESARRLASLAGAELMLVEVIQPFASPLERQSVAPSTFDVELTTARREEAADYLKDLAAQCVEAGVRTAYATPLGGNVADTLLGLAESPSVGLIAIATRGQGGIRRLAIGSVADKLVRTAQRPVLVYRPPGRAKRKKRS